ncbi:MAG: hypothetical protein IKZ07_05310 [Akkermansia sp.]|nr:hypothetical protein [Akkermansia sp.]
MSKKKRDFTQQEINHEREWYNGQSHNAYGHFILQNTPAGKKIRNFIADVCHTYDRLQMLGLSKAAREHLVESEKQCEYMFLDCASNDGIPDCISVRKLQKDLTNESDAERQRREIEKKRMLETLTNDSECPLVYRDVFQFPGEINFEMRGQLSSGTINKREESAIKMAAYLNDLSVASFITKASLYMARATNRIRKNMDGDQHTLGELYMLMEHGWDMRESYTKSEVFQALAAAGLSGCQVAAKFMDELDRLRDMRMERQRETSITTPTHGRKALNKYCKGVKKPKRNKKIPSRPIEDDDRNL